MRIGPVEIGPGALLAPMEAVTDLAFPHPSARRHGAVLTFTEFLSAEGLTRGAERVVRRMWPSLGGRRFGVQVFGREPDVLARRGSGGGRCRRLRGGHQHGLSSTQGYRGHVRRGAHARAALAAAIVGPCAPPCPRPSPSRSSTGWAGRTSASTRPNSLCAWSKQERPW